MGYRSSLPQHLCTDERPAQPTMYPRYRPGIRKPSSIGVPGTRSQFVYQHSRMAEGSIAVTRPSTGLVRALPSSQPDPARGTSRTPFTVEQGADAFATPRSTHHRQSAIARHHRSTWHVRAPSSTPQTVRAYIRDDIAMHSSGDQSILLNACLLPELKTRNSIALLLPTGRFDSTLHHRGGFALRTCASRAPRLVLPGDGASERTRPLQVERPPGRSVMRRHGLHQLDRVHHLDCGMNWM